jgi:hypothetical protein
VEWEWEERWKKGVEEAGGRKPACLADWDPPKWLFTDAALKKYQSLTKA